MSQLGPHYLWIVKLSMIEWPTLSAQEKQLHAVMRKSFVTSYAFGAEAILQHWLWKTLKNATKSFGPLLKVFATYDDRPFIVLTETKPSKRHIPVWARYLTLPPLAVPMLGNQSLLCSRAQALLSLISLL
jgi:hypothetical protein